MSLGSKNKFEIYLKEKISEDLPNYLLEDFKNYLNRYIKINNSIEELKLKKIRHELLKQYKL